MIKARNSEFMTMSLDEIIARKNAASSSKIKPSTSAVPPLTRSDTDTETPRKSGDGESTSQAVITTVRIPPGDPFKKNKHQHHKDRPFYFRFGRQNSHKRGTRRAARSAFGKNNDYEEDDGGHCLCSSCSSYGGGHQPPAASTPLKSAPLCCSSRSSCGGHHGCSAGGGQQPAPHQYHVSPPPQTCSCAGCSTAHGCGCETTVCPNHSTQVNRCSFHSPVNQFTSCCPPRAAPGANFHHHHYSPIPSAQPQHHPRGASNYFGRQKGKRGGRGFVHSVCY